MLKQNTLFVVGAGASCDFKFPTGNELIGELQRLTDLKRDTIGSVIGDGTFWRAANLLASNSGVTQEAALRVIQELHVLLGGAVNSIDQLVHTHSGNKNFAETAKLAIAKTIQFREFKSPLRMDEGKSYALSPLSHDNWLHDFSRLHYRGFERHNIESVFDNVAFLSFNYDRCIEQGLRRSFANYFKLTDQETIAVCDEVRVLHPYGSLGRLPNHSGTDSFSFGRGSDPTIVHEMSKRIKTFTEGNNDLAFKNLVTDLLDWAQTIVFVGFGYLPLNLRLLGTVDKTKSPKSVYGTATGMTAPNIAAVRANLAQQLHATETIHIDGNLSAKGFLPHFEFALFD